MLLLVLNCLPASGTDCVDVFCAMKEQAAGGLSRFLLPQTFFPNTNNPPYYVSIWSRMAIKYPNGSAICSNKNTKIVSTDSDVFQTHELANVTWYWTHKWTSSPLLKLLGNGNLYVHTSGSNFLSLAVLYVNQISLGQISNATICDTFCVQMNVDLVLNCTPFEDATRNLWETVIQWVSLILYTIQYIITNLIFPLE